MNSPFTRNDRIFSAAAAVAVILLAGTIQAQTRKPNAATNKPAEVPGANRAEQSVPVPVPTPTKRNERPDQTEPASGSSRKGAIHSNSTSVPAYRYEFSQPEFVVSNIKIEHDPDGAGTIAFKKKGSDETISDPIRVSPKSITKINDALAALNFLSSTENYQYEKDYSHLGVTKFAFTQNGRSRDISISWTENKDAKVLMDEYRRISNQYIWIFDISLSRENQPLDAPRLLDSLDSLIKRNEISDPLQMEPFLRELSNDERIPLIARNHAARLVTQFEKERKKASK
jgi:hypothetical protein